MKTHWKKLSNPDYLGAYALDPGQDLIVTIRSVGNENVIGSDGKKEECIVAHFKERDVKPMIINATNAKTVTKLLKSPYIEDWAGRKIQLFVDNVKAFGEVVEALRVRPFLPKDNAAPVCTECGNDVTATDKADARGVAAYTQKHYRAVLCADCLKRRVEAAGTGTPAETETAAETGGDSE